MATKYTGRERYAIIDRQQWRRANTLCLYFMAAEWPDIEQWLSQCPDSLKTGLLVVEKAGRSLIEMEI